MPGPRVLIVGAGLAGLNAAATLRQLARRAPKSKVPVQITLVEKSRSVGGRMATRRVPTDGEYGNSAAEVGEYGNSKGFVAMDTGAQLFRIRDEEFDSIVPTWVERGRAHEFGKGPPIIENLKGLMEDWQNGVNSASDSGSKQSDKSPGEIESKTCKVSGAVDPNTKYYYRGPGGMNGMARRFLEDLGEGDEVLLETEVREPRTYRFSSNSFFDLVFVTENGDFCRLFLAMRYPGPRLSA